MKIVISYMSYQSLWNHNKKFHNNINTQITNHTTITTQNTTILNNYKCNFCNKILSRKDSLTRHQKTCKEKQRNKHIDNIYRTVIDKLKRYMEKLKKPTKKYYK